MSTLRPFWGVNYGYTKVPVPSFPPGPRINIPVGREFSRFLAAECVLQATLWGGMSHCRGGRSAPGVFGVLSLLLCATLLMSCGSVDNAPANPPPPPPPPVPLSAADVQQVVE